MRRILRLKLSEETIRFLQEERVNKIARKRSFETKVAKAKSLWLLKKNRAFREIKRKLEKMASGLDRCMYCEDSASSTIDHFWPLALYPDKAFQWKNFLCACSFCNSNEKRDQFPRDAAGRPLLLKPTKDDPLEHLVLIPSTGELKPRLGSAKGQPTINVFGLNKRPALPKGRRNAFHALEALLVEYAVLRRRGLTAEAEAIKKVVKEYPFSGVFVYLLSIMSGPDAALLLRYDCLDALRAHPEVQTWLRSSPSGRTSTAASARA